MPVEMSALFMAGCAKRMPSVFNSAFLRGYGFPFSIVSDIMVPVIAHISPKDDKRVRKSMVNILILCVVKFDCLDFMAIPNTQGIHDVQITQKNCM